MAVLHRSERETIWRPVWLESVSKTRRCPGRVLTGSQRTPCPRPLLPSIVLKNSFWGDERNFLELLIRIERGDVRDHIDLSKIDHGPS